MPPFANADNARECAGPSREPPGHSQDHLGGHLVEAAVPAFKHDVKRLLDWYELELADQPTEIRFETDVTAELIAAERPDVTILATGSHSRLRRVRGAGLPHVATEVELLLGTKTAGDQVVMVGGGMIGCETALWLAQQSKHVTIVEHLDELMVATQVPVPHANRIMLIDKRIDDRPLLTALPPDLAHRHGIHRPGRPSIAITTYRPPPVLIG